MRQAILNLMKDYPFRLLAIALCPILVILGFLLLLLAGLLELPTVRMVATSCTELGFALLLPSGILCLALSWRMSHSKNDAVSDSRDLIEFLLGFFGSVMFIFGVIFSSWFLSNLIHWGVNLVS